MQQRVDPFIPIHKKPSPAGPYGAHYLRKHAAPAASSQDHGQPMVAKSSHAITRAQSQAVDGIIRPSLSKQRHLAQLHRGFPVSTALTPPVPRTVPAAVPPTDMKAQKRERATGAHRLWQSLQVVLIIFAAVCAGLLLQSLAFGELAIAVYAVFALTRRIASRTTFTLALTALGGIVLLLVIRGSSALSENFAVYAFLLLLVGMVSLGLEARRDGA
jgi:hypothetical protein